MSKKENLTNNQNENEKTYLLFAKISCAVSTIITIVVIIVFFVIK